MRFQAILIASKFSCLGLRPSSRLPTGRSRSGQDPGDLASNQQMANCWLHGSCRTQHRRRPIALRRWEGTALECLPGPALPMDGWISIEMGPVWPVSLLLHSFKGPRNPQKSPGFLSTDHRCPGMPATRERARFNWPSPSRVTNFASGPTASPMLALTKLPVSGTGLR